MQESADILLTISRITEILAGLEIRYHLTGGISVTIYSNPRTTLDVDVVADPSAIKAKFGVFIEAGQRCFDLNPLAVREALDRGGVCQLLDPETGVKVDLYLREGVPGELNRSVELAVAPKLKVRVVSPRDAVLSKLMWIKKGSHRSRRDVRWLVASLSLEDKKVLFEESRALGLDTLFNEVLSEEEPRE